MSISSCATIDQRLTASATAEGKVKAGVHLPAWPDDCRQQEAHADIAAGAELHGVLKRERSALDRQNARTGRCGTFYDTLKTRMEAP